MDLQSAYRGMTLSQARRAMARALLSVTDEREAANISQLAVEHVSRYSPVEVALHATEPLSDYLADRLAAITSRLLANEPIQHILGEAHWRGLALKVTPDTLIPRPETAQLVDIIVDQNHQPDLRVLDAGTGSGCIAIALARDLRFAKVTAVDISQRALSVASDNARTLKANVHFIEADALHLAKPETPYDIIVSNPPYIAWGERELMTPQVVDHEPQSALFVPDNDPTIFYAAIMRYAANGGARSGSRVYFEINPLFVDDLRRDSTTILPGAAVDFTRDMYGRQRFMTITLP